MLTTAFEVRGSIVRQRSPRFASVHFVAERRGHQFAVVRQGLPQFAGVAVRVAVKVPATAGVAQYSHVPTGDHEQMHICFDSRLVRLELVKRGWQLSDLATQSGLSEPTARAVLRGRGVSMVTALKVVRALERNPPNERLMALLNWHEAHPQPVVPSPLVTPSDR